MVHCSQMWDMNIACAHVGVWSLNNNNNNNNDNLIFNVDIRRKWLPNLPSQGLMLKRSTITS